CDALASRRRLECQQPSGSKQLVDSNFKQLRTESMIRYDEYARVCGELFDHVANRRIQPLIDLVNELPKFRRSARVVARMRWIHVSPVIVLGSIQHRENNHQKI